MTCSACCAFWFLATVVISASLGSLGTFGSSAPPSPQPLLDDPAAYLCDKERGGPNVTPGQTAEGCPNPDLDPPDLHSPCACQQVFVYDFALCTCYPMSKYQTKDACRKLGVDIYEANKKRYGQGYFVQCHLHGRLIRGD